MKKILISGSPCTCWSIAHILGHGLRNIPVPAWEMRKGEMNA